MSTLKLRHRLRSLLGINEPPKKIALSFAIGVFWGISPLLGLHTILALLSAWLLRLNRFVTITGVYVTNPWTIVPIYAFSTWVGTLITKKTFLSGIDWKNLSIASLSNELRPLLLSFIIGTLLVGAVSSLLSYLILKKAIERARGL
jgi:uncharacterized protein (DUF2062 family)